MKTFGLFLAISWLLRTTEGRLLLLLLVLWYLDNRYFGIVAALMAPIHHQRRIASLRQTVQVNPSDVRAMVELGEHYLRSGRFQAAAEYLERAFDRGEDSARAHYLLGGALVKLGRLEEGRERLEKALVLQPNVAYGEPYLFLIEEAAARGDAGRVAELVAELEQFESVEILTRAGHLCRQAGQAELARRLFAEAVQNYQYIPAKMRRRERRWLWRARLGQMQTR
ncbi:tetratricopeptide (TPR) repeat protein [Symbiobacterium terraclitae]|uniref:Tetratricopeptide (TPR) repeat protein n=1 Tax=Symbiobacterium terraclitae TaxID=557451 RepID=A0ABS4JXD7_9FIRM|nr:tetratricopeptide (TPR) repeat protein [Symbiobacterium terraclitae]